jgi:hypothetical protein
MSIISQTDTARGSLFLNEDTGSPLCGLGTNAALQGNKNKQRVTAKKYRYLLTMLVVICEGG